MRLFIWSIIITIILLLGFIGVAAPMKQQSIYTLPVHKTLYLERSIYDEEMAHILAAAAEWHDVTNGQVTFDIKRLPQKKFLPLDAIIIFNVTPDFPDIILLDNVKGNRTLGYFNNQSGYPYIALVDERIANSSYNAVVMHELGHALGMDHPDLEDSTIGIGSLMYSTIDAGSNHITNFDLKRFCKLYHCDPSKFHGIP